MAEPAPSSTHASLPTDLAELITSRLPPLALRSLFCTCTSFGGLQTQQLPTQLRLDVSKPSLCRHKAAAATGAATVQAFPRLVGYQERGAHAQPTGR